MPTGAVRKEPLDSRPPPVANNAPEAGELDELYAQYIRYVWRCLRSLGVYDDELDDAIQNVFLVARKRLAEFDGQASHKTWLYAIALRVARRYRTRQTQARLRVQYEGEPNTVTEPVDAECAMARNQRLAIAREALASRRVTGGHDD